MAQAAYEQQKIEDGVKLASIRKYISKAQANDQATKLKGVQLEREGIQCERIQLHPLFLVAR